MLYNVTQEGVGEKGEKEKENQRVSKWKPRTLGRRSRVVEESRIRDGGFREKVQVIVKYEKKYEKKSRMCARKRTKKI